MTKQFYQTPSTKILVVRFEGCLCGSPDGTWDKSIKEGSKWGSTDDDLYGLD